MAANFGKDFLTGIVQAYNISHSNWTLHLLHNSSSAALSFNYNTTWGVTSAMESTFKGYNKVNLTTVGIAWDAVNRLVSFTSDPCVYSYSTSASGTSAETADAYVLENGGTFVFGEPIQPSVLFQRNGDQITLDPSFNSFE